MLELLPGFPDHIVAIVAHGHITRQDYTEVLIPKVERAFKGREKIRFYYETGEDFAGIDPAAAWEDFKLGMTHLTGWERAAIVTDVAWMRMALHAFQFMIPGEVRLFAQTDAAEARRWIAG